jgi:hypothetical protein
MGAQMSNRLIVLNALMAALAVFLLVQLVRGFAHSRPLPSPPPPRQATPAAAPPVRSAPSGDALASYNVIPAKSLFSPTRGEGPAAAPSAVPLPPKPVLHGLVVDGARSVAYLEDPVTKRIFAYRVGDAVAGGQLERITEDRVVIRRADGQIDVLLSDPSKLPAGPAVPEPGAGPSPPGGRPVRPPPTPGARAPRVLPGEQTTPAPAPAAQQ